MTDVAALYAEYKARGVQFSVKRGMLRWSGHKRADNAAIEANADELLTLVRAEAIHRHPSQSHKSPTP